MAFNVHSDKTFGTYPEFQELEDENYFKEIETLYANVLDAAGLNIKDPLEAVVKSFFKEQKKGLVDPPKVGKTYIFMTRPDLNFTYKTNVNNVALFQYMADSEVGKYLMPQLMFPSGWYDEDGDEVIRNTIGGNPIELKYQLNSPFIPLITNTCVSTSGGKDISIETYETEGDHHGNRTVYAAGADDSFTVGEISLDFNDVYRSMVMHLINLWVMYMYYYCKGIVDTRWKYKKKKIIDYSCSIYIIMTGMDHYTIERMIKYTGCFPRNIPLGAIQHNMDLSIDALRNFSVSFAYNRYEPMTPKIIGDFNQINRPFLKFGRSIAFPEPLIKPSLVTAEYLHKHPEFSPPFKRTRKSEQDEKGKMTLLTKRDYDSIFFGKTPYIIGDKLLWIETDQTDKQYLYENMGKSETFGGRGGGGSTGLGGNLQSKTAMMNAMSNAL